MDEDLTSPGATTSVGLTFVNGALGADPAYAAALVTAAERVGFESLWAVQHVVIPVEHVSKYPYSSTGKLEGDVAGPVPDPLVWLAWAGALTATIRLATGVFILPQQHPLVVAKQVATVDRLTGGRVILGVGVGWLREEFEALDSSFDDRGQRMDEAVQVLRRSWAAGPTSFDGTQISFPPVHMSPKPTGLIPIVIGGHTAAAARRAGRLGDGFFPLGCPADRLVELVELARRTATEHGRDPALLEITADAPRTPADAEAQQAVGVDRVVINAPGRIVDDLDGELARRLAKATALFR